MYDHRWLIGDLDQLGYTGAGVGVAHLSAYA